MNTELSFEPPAPPFTTAGVSPAADGAYDRPAFYDREIHARQCRALEPWLRVAPGARGAQVSARDVASLALRETFDLILGVMVLERIPEPPALRAAVLHMREHLAEGGTLVLLEAAPRYAVVTCNGNTFSARPRSLYLRLFAECGLRVRAMTGVESLPAKASLPPDLPRPSGWARPAVLALVSACAIPIERLLGRSALDRSWHVVFVLERAALRH